MKPSFFLDEFSKSSFWKLEYKYTFPKDDSTHFS